MSRAQKESLVWAGCLQKKNQILGSGKNDKNNSALHSIAFFQILAHLAVTNSILRENNSNPSFSSLFFFTNQRIRRGDVISRGHTAN